MGEFLLSFLQLPIDRGVYESKAAGCAYMKLDGRRGSIIACNFSGCR